MTPLSYLDIYLGPFVEHLCKADVTDIYVNRPGELWVETLGGGVERHLAPELDEALLLRLARQIASITHQGISREHPLLAAALPDGARVQVIASPATRSGLILAFRKHVSANFRLDQYEAAGAFNATRGAAEQSPIELELGALYDERRWTDFLRLSVRARKTIMVAGGTSTGKTTFANALVAEIAPSERLVLIEDTPELVMTHANAVGLIAVRGEQGEASVTTDDLLTASLRMRPDRIILGEIRGSEAFTFLRAVNTGHPGSISTIHADTPGRAIEQLALLALQSRANLRHEDVLAYLTSVIDIIVQLDRRHGQRSVSQIWWRERPMLS